MQSCEMMTDCWSFRLLGTSAGNDVICLHGFLIAMSDQQLNGKQLKISYCQSFRFSKILTGCWSYIVTAFKVNHQQPRSVGLRPLP